MKRLLIILLSIASSFGAGERKISEYTTRNTPSTNSVFVFSDLQANGTYKIYPYPLLSLLESASQRQLIFKDMIDTQSEFEALLFALPSGGSSVTFNPTTYTIPMRTGTNTLADSPFRVIDGNTNFVGFNTTNKFISSPPNLLGHAPLGVGLEALNSYNNAAGTVTPTAVGYKAFRSLTTGSGTAVGEFAGSSSTTGSGNTYVGANSGLSATVAQNNTAVGKDALYYNTNSNGTALGYQAGSNLKDAARSVIVGARPLVANERTDRIWNDVILIGDKDTRTNNVQTITNSIYVGNNMVPENSNEIIIGNTNQTSAKFAITSNDGSTTRFLAADGQYRTAGGSSGVAGTVINTGTPVENAIPRYSNTTGTNIEPSSVIIEDSPYGAIGFPSENDTNISLTLRAHPTMTTNVAENGWVFPPPDSSLVKVLVSGTNVYKTNAIAGTDYFAKSGSSVANDITVFDGTNQTLRHSTSAANFGDSSSATFTVNFGLSGATDPSITAGNNSLTLTANSITASGTFLSGNGAAGAGALSANGLLFVSRGRISASSDGVFSFRNNTDTANASITAGTLTLTPSAADTTALTVSGGSTTGSGTTKGGTFLHTLNSSGVVDGVWTFGGTETASGAGSKWIKVVGGAAGTTELLSLNTAGSLTASGNITSTGGNIFVGVNNAFIGGTDAIFRRDASAVWQMGTDTASPISQKLKATDGVGTDIGAGSITIAGGQSTGTGRGGAIIGQTSPSGSTGSSANAYSERYHYAAKDVTLSEGSATTVATVAVPSAKFVGGNCVVTVFASDATDHQARTLTFPFSAINKAGTVTAGLGTPVESIAASSGTLTATITTVANGNAVDIKVSATSSLTQTTLSATVAFPAINSNDTAAVTEI